VRVLRAEWRLKNRFSEIRRYAANETQSNKCKTFGKKTEQVKQPVLRIGRGTSRLVVHWGRKTKRFRRKTTFQLTHASGKVAWMVDHIFSMIAKDVAFVA